jgi:hypothetical protein
MWFLPATHIAGSDDIIPKRKCQMSSWKPEVQTDNSGKWYGNGLRFATLREAEENARDLSYRWLAVREHRAAESEDPVNYAYVDHKLVAVTP